MVSMVEPAVVECPGCFQQKGIESAICSRCGYHPDALRSLSLLPVQTQLERYVIGEKLGQGGFGITYRGFDLKLRMRVAIKEYYPSDVVGRSADRKTLVSENDDLFKHGLNAFVNEAHTLAQLQHPNLVRVLNLFEMNGTAYLVMDYYEGETLYEYLTRQPAGKLPWRRAVNLLLPVLDSLREVHRSGFMHRDIKPRNLYLTHRDQLVLLDFGAARQVVSDRTRSRVMPLTIGYAAYEQFVLGKQGPWTDVYGVAATLYVMLTGQVPLSAQARKQQDSLQPARHFSPDLPEALDNVLYRALAVEPGQRLQSAGEFKQQLEAVLAEETKPLSDAPASSRPPRTLKQPAAIALSLVILAGVGWLILSKGTAPYQSPAEPAPAAAKSGDPVARSPVPSPAKETLEPVPPKVPATVTMPEPAPPPPKPDDTARQAYEAASDQYQQASQSFEALVKRVENITPSPGEARRQVLESARQADQAQNYEQAAIQMELARQRLAEEETAFRAKRFDLQLTAAKGLFEKGNISAARRALEDAKDWDQQGKAENFRREQTAILQAAAQGFLERGRRDLAKRVIDDLAQWDPQAPEYRALRERLGSSGN